MTGTITTTDLGDPTSRKGRGAFFTPAALTDFVCDWAIRERSDVVLEPSCGDGAFLLAAARRLASLGCQTDHLDLHGLDIHADSAAASGQAVLEAGYRADVQTADFFTVPGSPTFNAVVGNPPFVRYQDFSGDARIRGREAALRAGVGLTALSSSWAAFVVHATQFLRPGARMGMVLPAELLTVNYASAVRSHLLSSFGSVRLVVFAERVFPDVLEEVVLLLADDAGRPGGTDHFDLQQVDSVTDLVAPAVPHDDPRRFTPTLTSDKWSAAFLSETASGAYTRLLEDGTFTGLQTWGETTLGSVTGNNDFFTLTPAEASALRLRPDETTPISPPGSRHLRQLTLTSRSWTDLGAAGKRTLLFRPGADLASMSRGARARITEGERIGVPAGYKCRHRSPWWQVPLVDVPDLFLTYMNADTPRFAANPAGVRHLNSVHGVYVGGRLGPAAKSLLPLATLNTVTMLGAELVGRAYGGGILKLEPREADLLPVPSPGLVASRAGALRNARRRIRHAVERGDLAAAVTIVDDILWGPATAHSDKERAALMQAHDAFALRRTSRSGRTR